MIIGIVGEAGVGKTTATNFFQSLGLYIISVDKIVKHIYTLPATRTAIIAEFGNEFLDNNKMINMKKLRMEAFQHPAILRKLEVIIWPTMVQIIRDDINANKKRQPAIIIDCAVLFNAQLHHLVDKVILIEADEEKKIQRIKNRDHVETLQVMALLKHQKQSLILNKNIDFIIKNNNSISDFLKQLRAIAEKLKIIC